MKLFFGFVMVMVALSSLTAATSGAATPKKQRPVAVYLRVQPQVKDGGTARVSGTIVNRKKAAVRYVSLLVMYNYNDGSLDIADGQGAKIADIVSAKGVTLSSHIGSLSFTVVRPGPHKFSFVVKVPDRVKASSAEATIADFFCIGGSYERVVPGKPYAGWFYNVRGTCAAYVAKK